jgi:hypothetical protein
MEREDWNLLVLASAEGQPLSPVQLQKALFLVSRNLPPEVLGGPLYDFVPYNYGPFDGQVYDDARRLADEQFAQVSKSPRGWTQYAATPEGVERARIISETLKPDVVEYMATLVRWVRAQSFPSLVRTIYDRYPEMRANSVFQD